MGFYQFDLIRRRLSVCEESLIIRKSKNKINSIYLNKNGNVNSRSKKLSEVLT